MARIKHFNGATLQLIIVTLSSIIASSNLTYSNLTSLNSGNVNDFNAHPGILNLINEFDLLILNIVPRSVIFDRCASYFSINVNVPAQCLYTRQIRLATSCIVATNDTTE